MINTLYSSSATAVFNHIQFQQFQTGKRDFNYNLIMSEYNYAFLDMQNIHMGVMKRNWAIEWADFRKLLTEKFNVTEAIAFFGYLKEYECIYDEIERAGFTPHFRTVKRIGREILKGDIDVDLATLAMHYQPYYNKAVIIADDADYQIPIRILNEQNKLKMIISSNIIQKTSDIIKEQVDRNLIISIHSLRNIIERKKIN